MNNFRFPQPAIPGLQRFSHQAMATVFEILLPPAIDASYAAQAAQEVFAGIDRLEQVLSRFIENSDISRINRRSAREAVAVGPDAFACLTECRRLYHDTGGAFDISAGRLLACWRGAGSASREPGPAELAAARAATGMDHLFLDENAFTVWSDIEISLDLGGYGKGYALDRAAETLREWEIDSFLLHGGRSTVLAGAVPAGREGWPVTLSHPGDPQQPLARLALREMSLSGSGRQKGVHIIDPRSGQPAAERLATWSLAPGGALSDALSTAWMIMAPEAIAGYCQQHPATGALLLPDGSPDQALAVERFGMFTELHTDFTD